jgi:hypothetical protein
MNLCRSLRLSAATTVAACLIAPTAYGQTPPNEKSPSAKAAGGQEKASGVIIKAEQVGIGQTSNSTPLASPQFVDTRAMRRRITINLDAVWRDWARDQARIADNRSAKEQAKAGVNSVATTGEPVDRNNVVVVDVGPETVVDTRFRAPDDQTGKGSKTPGTAGAANPKGGGRSAAKPVEFRADDLKPGLFVEVDYRNSATRNPARTVTVIRPVGGPDTPARTGATSNK